MKKLVLTIATLCSIATMANNYSDLTQAQCTRSCTFYAYDFTPDFMDYCGQIEKCDLLEWDAEAQVCVVEEADVLITYPMQCRDIPAS